MRNSCFSTAEEKQRTKISPADVYDSLQRRAHCCDPLSAPCQGNPQFLCSSIPMLFFISLHGKYYLGHFKATVSDPDKSRSEINLSLTSLIKYGVD